MVPHADDEGQSCESFSFRVGQNLVTIKVLRLTDHRYREGVLIPCGPSSENILLL